MAAAVRRGIVAQSWWLGMRLVSIRLVKQEGGGVWKDADRLSTAVPDELLPALSLAGVHHASSYADAFHQLAPRLPPLRAVYNRMFEHWPGGPWEEAKLQGDLKGRWYRYDLRQAYRWAGSLGLPVADRMVIRNTWRDESGLWLCDLVDPPREELPPIFRQPHGLPLVMSTEEIEGYKLRVRVLRGVTWDTTTSADYIESTLRRLPCAKESARSYWGRYIVRDAVTVRTPSNEWELTTPFRNLPWGWLIVGRVRLRVWEMAGRAAHVYVDEVVVPHEIEGGPDVPGSWRLKERYDRGITVHRVGHFGPRDRPATMQTGVPRHVA